MPIQRALRASVTGGGLNGASRVAVQGAEIGAAKSCCEAFLCGDGLHWSLLGKN